MAKPTSSPVTELPIPTNGTAAATQLSNELNGEPLNVPHDETRAWLRGVAAIQNADDIARALHLSNLLAGESTLWDRMALDAPKLSQIAVAAMLPTDPSWRALDAKLRPLFIAWQADRDEAEQARQQAAAELADATAALLARKLQLETELLQDSDLVELEAKVAALL